jgi:AcrR family transcriptional regulator
MTAAGARQRRKLARPQELLDAALDLFVEKGFAATRSEEVAARAGVSKGTLYLYYPSKEELLKEVIRQNVVNQIAEGVEIVRAFEGSSSELLAHMMRLWWQRVGETRASGILKLMMSEVRNFPEIAEFYIDEVTAPCDRMLAEIVERGIARGEFRPVVPLFVHLLVMASLNFFVISRAARARGAKLVGNPNIDPEPAAFARFVADMVTRGLAQGENP